MSRRNFTGRRNRVDRVASFVLAVSILLLAAAPLGGAYAVLDLINLVAAPLALASLLIAAFLLTRARTWPGRALLGLCCIPGLLLLLPRAAAFDDCGPTTGHLRIAWINAHHPAQSGPIVRWLQAEQPQVVGVAELRPGLPLRQALEERYPYWQSCLGNGRCSTLLYSRIPPVRLRGLARGDPENRQALSAVRMDLVPNAARRRSPPLQIMAVHLSRPLPLGRQARELLALDNQLRSAPDTIVMGDFNLSPRMQLLRDFAARNGLSVTPAPRPTWPISVAGHSLPGLWQIDHLLVGKDWQVAAMRTGPDVGSDHKGFVADLCRRDN